MSNGISSMKNVTHPNTVGKVNSKTASNTNIDPDSSFEQHAYSNQEKEQKENPSQKQKKVEINKNAIDLTLLEFIGQVNKLAINNNKKPDQS